MMEIFLQPHTWISLLTLTILEIVLGIDNLVFIAIISSRLPAKQQKPARRVGLIFALVTRLLLLGAITWLTKFTYPLFTLFGQSFSGRDLILIGGGLFLLAKSTSEIHVDMTDHDEEIKVKARTSFTMVIIQIMVLDIIFSLDSIITAIGLAQDFVVMALAIVIAVLMMIFASEPLSRIVNTYPTLKMLALSFLILIGAVLIADGFAFHVPRGYLYFAIAFSLFVEMLNVLAGRRKSGKQVSKANR